jgi:phosphoglycolate phosphatase
MTKDPNRKIGIIFDLDGTLLNTLDDLADAVNQTLCHFGYLPRTYEEIRRFVGNGVKVLMKKSCPEKLTDERFSECLTYFQDYYKKNMLNKTKPYPGVMEMLGELKKRGVAVGIVSNKFQKAVTGLWEIFFKDAVAVAIGNREGVLPKPAPDSVMLAISELKLDPKRDLIYYVGDSETDILTARNANLPIISVTWGFRTIEELRSSGAGPLIDQPDGIYSYLES